MGPLKHKLSAADAHIMHALVCRLPKFDPPVLQRVVRLLQCVHCGLQCFCITLVSVAARTLSVFLRRKPVFRETPSYFGRQRLVLSEEVK